jgi:hypothetical protein
MRRLFTAGVKFLVCAVGECGGSIGEAFGFASIKTCGFYCKSHLRFNGAASRLCHRLAHKIKLFSHLFVTFNENTIYHNI